MRRKRGVSVLDGRDLLLMNHDEEEDRTTNPNQEILSVKFTETAFKVLLQSKAAINSAIQGFVQKNSCNLIFDQTITLGL